MKLKTYIIPSIILTSVIFVLIYNEKFTQSFFIMRQGIISADEKEAQKNLMFIKTHKTGSSTLGGMFYLYGIKRRLNFVLKPFKNTLNNLPEHKLGELLKPRPGESWNIQVQHCVFNPDFEHLVLPKNRSFYTTVLRSPVSQFKSSFTYYGAEAKLRKRYGKNYTFDDLVNKHIDIKCPKYSSIKSDLLQNCLYSTANDLGWANYKNSVKQENNLVKVDAFIKMLDHEMDFVMITERMEESLIVLKEYLNWDMSDILFLSKKVASKTPNRELLQETEDRILNYKYIDKQIFDYFNSSLDKHILKLGREKIAAETDKFREVRKSFEDECKKNTSCLGCSKANPDCDFLQYEFFRHYSMVVTDLQRSDDYKNQSYEYKNSAKKLKQIVTQIMEVQRSDSPAIL